MTYFVDTNFFLRFLLRDQNNQYLEVEKIFLQAARGEFKLISSTPVLFEIYWVLSSYYQHNKKNLAAALVKILEMEFIEFEEIELLQKALFTFARTALDLEDSFNLSYAVSREVNELKTFDKKLLKLYQKSLKKN